MTDAIAATHQELRMAERRIAELESELRGAHLMIGYLAHDYGDDGEITISAGTMQMYDGFVIDREDMPSGGLLLRARPRA